MTNLIERLEKATELDAELFRMVCDHLGVKIEGTLLDLIRAHAWTDAALALAERVLPGCELLMEVSGSTSATCDIWLLDTGWTGEHFGKTLPLAICVATLRAHEAQLKGEGHD